MTSNETVDYWTCAACTFSNNLSSNERCTLCNTPHDYLEKQKMSNDEQLKIYTKLYTDYFTEVDIQQLISFFYPYPNMNGCNSGKTAVSEIMEDSIYLSGSSIVQNMEWLKKTGITAILNCAFTDIQHSKELYSNIHLLQLPINDTSKDRQLLKSEYLLQALEFIEVNTTSIVTNTETNQKTNKILIHCSAGVSRSATILIAYLMCKLKWHLLKAFAYVRKRRAYVYPNLGFWKLLIEYHNELFVDCNGKNVEKKLLEDILMIHSEKLGEMMHVNAYSSNRNQKIKLW